MKAFCCRGAVCGRVKLCQCLSWSHSSPQMRDIQRAKCFGQILYLIYRWSIQMHLAASIQWYSVWSLTLLVIRCLGYDIETAQTWIYWQWMTLSTRRWDLATPSQSTHSPSIGIGQKSKLDRPSFGHNQANDQIGGSKLWYSFVLWLQWFNTTFSIPLSSLVLAFPLLIEGYCQWNWENW